MRLKGKTALITGGNSGIGLATARRFVAEGARVAITGRDAATLAAAANELGVTATRSDVLDAQARSSLFDRIKDEFGHLDILFANAGIAKFSPIEETLEKDFDEVLRTNVTAVFLTVQAALALMGAGASIILNGSIAATIVLANLPPTQRAKPACGRCAARSQVSSHRAVSGSMPSFPALSKRPSGGEWPYRPKPLRQTSVASRR